MDHVSVHLKPTRQGGHTWVAVWAGADSGHHAKCGELAFRNEEWEILRHFLDSVPIFAYDHIDLQIDRLISLEPVEDRPIPKERP